MGLRASTLQFQLSFRGGFTRLRALRLGARTFPVAHLSDTKWHLRHAFAGGGWCNGARLVGFCTTLVHRKNDESPGQGRFLWILGHLANPQRIHLSKKVTIHLCVNRVVLYE